VPSPTGRTITAGTAELGHGISQHGKTTSEEFDERQQ
jgi:hypothetical protein